MTFFACVSIYNYLSLSIYSFHFCLDFTDKVFCLKMFLFLLVRFLKKFANSDDPLVTFLTFKDLFALQESGTA